MTALAGVFHEPLGVDFSAAFAAGLRERLSDPRPEAVARVTLLVNTNRMGRRIQAAFAEQGATLLPKVRMVSDIVGLLPPGALPPTTHRPLADRLALSQLVRALLERAPTLSPPSAAFDMAGTLMALMTEMQEEAVPPEALAALDLGDMAAHWQTSWQFLQIAMAFAAEAGLAPVAARQEAALALLADRWTTDPPKDPVLIAGSTASRGQTQRLMKLVLTLPQGGVVLPGMDTTMPAAAWTDLTAGEGNLSAPQDHPQYRHAAFLRALGLDRDQCQKWSGTAPRVPERTALLSLALRPAPATNAWQEEGPKLKGVGTACARVTLLHAPTPSTEAAAIALGLRAALDDNKRAALISPDRTLTRQVAAYLGRWNILPDDSAGVPLVQSSPGRFLMLSGQMLGRPVEAEALTILLNHPLCHGAGGRRKHLDRARAMELTLLRKGPCPFPDPQRVTEWANRAGIDPTWVSWLTDALGQMAASTATGPLVQFVSAHQALVAQLSTGSAAAERDPWSAPGGAAALGVLASLVDAAPALGDTPISVGEYTRILHAVLAAEELREPHAPHPDIMIWGALEARARSADLVILGGLNDGIWPAQPEPDPWLNRAMRAQVGLRLPDRVIGLSAHDFQQAASAPEVWLTRAARNAEAETVPSRWLNRLERLLTGLGAAGETAHASMLARGKTWLTQAQALTEPQAKHVQPAAPRPGPKPPATALPATLSVTQIETLIRDPYAIYAQKILQLQSLAPLRQGPDGRVRGSTLHTAMERFTEAAVGPKPSPV
ncbi:MAG: double-strand break repair protein AddB, partial [Pseudomonadota bacterium]